MYSVTCCTFIDWIQGPKLRFVTPKMKIVFRGNVMAKTTILLKVIAKQILAENPYTI